MNPREAYLSVRDGLSSGLAIPFMDLLRAQRRGSRDDARHYRAGRALRRVAMDWSEPKRIEWMLAALRRTVRYAYASTEFYRERLDAIGFDPSSDFTFDEYALLPILERQDVQQGQVTLLSREVDPRNRRWNATGGSSGTPVELFTGPEERGWRLSGADDSMARIGSPRGVRRALLWGHHLDPVARSGLMDRLVDFSENTAWFDSLRLSDAILERYDAQLRAFRPRCLIAYASALHSLAEVVLRKGAPAPYPTRCIVTGAEKLYAEQRRAAEQAFGVPVHERYGSRDVGDMAFQYAPRQGLQFTVDWALVLLEPAGDGPESEILVTKLHADAMPMLRYRTDDVGLFPTGSRRGHPTWTLDGIVGRRVDRVYRKDGSWLNGLHFPHLLKDLPITDFQVVQAEDYSVDVRIVLRDGADISALDRLRVNLGANLPDLAVTVSPVAAIPRTKANKWRPVTTAVKQP